GLLAPDRLVVEVRDGEPFYTYDDPLGHRHYLTRADVVHVRGVTLDGLRGASPVALCREAHGLSAALAAHASSFMSNGAAPGGVLKVPPGPGAEEVLEN